MSDETTYVPPGVQEELDQLVGATDGQGAVERVDDRRYRMIVTSERVRLTMDLKTTGPGRWRWAGSTLQVDGEPRPLVSNLTDLGRVFRNPDVDLDEPEVGVPDPMPPARPVSEAPIVVAQQYRNIVSRLGEHAEIQLGSDGPLWVIGVTMQRGSLRLRFQQRRRDLWALARGQSFQLIIDGVDRTAAANNDVSQALAMMAGQRGDAATASPSIGAPSGSARTNSVEVRRSTVVRI